MKHLLTITICTIFSTSCTILPLFSLEEIEYCIKDKTGEMVICKDGEYVQDYEFEVISVYD